MARSGTLLVHTDEREGHGNASVAADSCISVAVTGLHRRESGLFSDGEHTATNATNRMVTIRVGPGILHSLHAMRRRRVVESMVGCSSKRQPRPRFVYKGW